MTQPTYYTVITGKRAYLVTYAASPDYAVRLFGGAFRCPGEASQEFKIAVTGDHEYLDEETFQAKVRELASRYSQDLAKLAAWNQGKPIRFEQKDRAMTNEQYFNNLSTNGLELAEAFLEEDLETLQANDLPVSDTVIGLLMVHALKVDEQSEQELTDESL